MALCRELRGIAAIVLGEVGLDIDIVRTEVIQALSGFLPRQ